MGHYIRIDIDNIIDLDIDIDTAHIDILLDIKSHVVV